MKLKVKKDRAEGGRILVLEGDKGDELDYVDAERLQRGDLDAFLPFMYERGRKGYRMTYRLGACESLAEVLKAGLAPFQLRALLTSLLHMVRLCEDNDLSRLHVMFDLDHVFFDRSLLALRFVYVPLRSYSSQIGETAMLGELCEKAGSAGSDGGLGAAVLDYARRTTVLTSVAFEDFLRGQGLYAADAAEPARMFSELHDTDALDTRGSHGWDFVRCAQQGQEQRKARDGQRFLLVRLSDKSSFALGNGAYTIGRAGECAITLANAKGVSRKHARIIVRGDLCSLEDLGSTNGVFVNGRRLAPDAPASLKAGDRFALAHEEFELL